MAARLSDGPQGRFTGMKKTFSFPYDPPYEIQTRFMADLYGTIKSRRVGIFESPTGTGKTLSLICGALTWLTEAQEESDDGDQQSGESRSSGSASQLGKSQTPGAHSDEPDWAVDFDSKQEGRERARRRRERRDREVALRAKLAVVKEVEKAEAIDRAADKLRAGDGPGKPAVTVPPGERKRSRPGANAAAAAAAGASSAAPSPLTVTGEDEFLLGEVNMGDVEGEGGGGGAEGSRDGRRGGRGSAGESRATMKSMSLADQMRAERDAESSKFKPGDEGWTDAGGTASGGGGAPREIWDDPSYVRPKLYFVSRTHSQIAQFVRELRRTPFGASLRVVALGGRRQLCVNDEVNSLGSDSLINERCLELQDASRKKAGDAKPGDGGDAAGAKQQGGKKLKGGAGDAQASSGNGGEGGSSSKCGSGGGCPYLANADDQTLFRDRLLASGRDIEEAASLGRDMGTCAYYGSRKAVAQAHVIAMPYTTLLHRGTRESMGLDTRGAVIIVDEAHNIIDALNGMHSVTVTLPQLAASHAQVRAYLDRYRQRLSRDNLWYCTQLVDVLGSLVRWLRGGAAPAKPRAPPAKAVAPEAASDGAPAAGGNGAAAASGEASSGAATTEGASSAAAQLESTAPPPQAPPPPPAQPRSSIHSVSDFLYASGCDNVNLFRLREYVERAQLLRKLRGFTEAGLAAATAAATGEVHAPTATSVLAPLTGQVAIHARPRSGGAGTSSGSSAGAAQSSAPSGNGSTMTTAAAGPTPAGPGFNISSVTALQVAHSFLSALTNTDGDGRVVVDRGEATASSVAASGNGSSSSISMGGASNGAHTSRPGAPKGAPASLKFVMLNPAVHFREVVDSARSVILAGGTMQPVEEVAAQLFGHLPPDRLHLFSCGHIIPPDHLLPLAVARAPSGAPWDFRFAARRSTAQMDDLGRALLNLVAVVPAGVVVFLPSYDFERALLEHWSKPVVAGAATAGGGGLAASVSPPKPSYSSVSSARPMAGASAASPTGVGNGFSRTGLAAGSSYPSSASQRAPPAPGSAQNIISPSGSRRGNAAAAEAVRILQEQRARAAAAEPPIDVAGLQVSPSSVLAQLSKRKAVFREPKVSSDLERTLREYAAAATAPGNWPSGGGGSAPGTPTAKTSAPAAAAAGGVPAASGPAGARTGALLFSVIGGKMSEGINFSDDLARCVVVVGLPFPNPADPELRERMAYLDRTLQGSNVAAAALAAAGAASGGGVRLPAGTASSSSSSSRVSAGNDYYENLCMKAVNQSIGRSIRHARDFACILLLDARYVSNARIRAKVPGWIGDKLQSQTSWPGVLSALGGFFRGKRAVRAAAAAATEG